MSGSDNAGVAPEDVDTDEELKGNITGLLDMYLNGNFSLTIDGARVEDFERQLVEATSYTVDIPSEPNFYSCNGAPGVSGEFSGYSMGMWVMLSPPTSATVDIAFSAELDFGDDELFNLDVSYVPLTVRP